MNPKAKPAMVNNFSIQLPTEIQPLPKVADESSTTGFRFRGTKGWLWRPEQYLAEIPVLGQYRMNFLMNCYGSMCDIEHYAWGDPKCNRWWEPLPDEKRLAFEKIVRECQEHNITFCFSMNPNLTSERILDYSNRKDFEALWAHYAWMQGLGVRWFNISLDDITHGIDAAGQARVVNDLFARLREEDPGVQFIFCPTHYWGNGKNDPYLETLARDLNPEVYVFWTGDGVVGPITLAAAKSYRKAVNHRLFLWDNYPVNDGHPTLHLGPVTQRDPDLFMVIDGYMSNPMHRQNEINRIPLYTCADYALNPRGYDPARSIGQAILRAGQTAGQREALRDLVELYPGFLLGGQASTGWNPVRARMAVILSEPDPKRDAKAYVEHVESVADRMDHEFPGQYEAARRTVRDDASALEEELRDRDGK